MTLRYRTGFIISAILACTAVVLFGAFAAVLSRQVQRVERSSVNANMDRVVSAVGYHVRSLDGKLSDWASWDDTYVWMHDRNPAYARSNLLAECFESLQANSIIMLDTKGRLFWGKTRKLHGGALEPVPPALMAHLKPDSWLLDLEPSSDYSRSGIVVVDGTPTMIAARPILTSTGAGPARGAMVITRDIDAEEVEALSQVVRLPLRVVRPGDPTMPDDFKLAIRQLSTTKRPVALPASESTAAGFGLARDIYGKPAAVVRVEMPRDAYVQAKGSLAYLALSLAVVAILASVAAIGLMDRAVLSPLGALTSGVRSVGAAGDLTMRVDPVERSGELGVLAAEINRMLSAIETTHDALAESEQRYRAVVEQASDCIYLVELDSGRIVEANQVLLDMLGRDADDVDRLTVRDVVVEEPGDRGADDRQNAPVGSHAVAERRYRRADGSELDVEEAANVIGYRGKQVLCVVARDITVRKHVEQLKEDFAAMVSHELRSPLTSILGFSALATEALPQDADPKLTNALSKIRAKSEHMARLVEDLLRHASARAGKLKLVVGQADMRRLALGCIEAVPSSSTHTILLDAPEDLPPLRCDAERMSYAISNLLSNAVKYSPDGGTVRVILSAPDSRFRVEVEDHGIGVPAADRDRIFDRFTQGDMSATRRFGGVGLGLHIVKEIVDAHGGRVEVRSQVGKGSTFAIVLPREPRGAGSAGDPV